MNPSLTLDRCVVRGTHAHKGRTRSLDPTNTAARQLHYGRIVLDGGRRPPALPDRRAWRPASSPCAGAPR